MNTYVNIFMLATIVFLAVVNMIVTHENLKVRHEKLMLWNALKRIEIEEYEKSDKLHVSTSAAIANEALTIVSEPK